MLRAPLLVLAAVLALAGCGGGGGGGGSGQLTKDEFVSQANAICKQYRADIDALGEPQSVEDLVGLAEKAVPIAEKVIASLHTLKPPAALQADVDAWLASGDANVGLLTKLRDAAKAGDVAAVTKLGDEGQTNSDKGKKLASKLGLAECAKE